ncbi:MAG: hypothetical protein J5J00_08915 [Deltaproteobacteria bacterium]|nr:hypothetical protein [Deltaproteobacteria bacterium]
MKYPLLLLPLACLLPLTPLLAHPPNCKIPELSAVIWPPNHKFVHFTVTGVTDPDGDEITVNITSIFQDERTQEPGSGNTCGDAYIHKDGTASVLAERNGRGTGRVYHIDFIAVDEDGLWCKGGTEICVPHDMGVGSECIDEGPLYRSDRCTGVPGANGVLFKPDDSKPNFIKPGKSKSKKKSKKGGRKGSP